MLAQNALLYLLESNKKTNWSREKTIGAFQVSWEPNACPGRITLPASVQQKPSWKQERTIGAFE
jgi:hypothetical protein